jgi:integrase
MNTMACETCKCKCRQLISFSSDFEKWRAFIDILDSINARDGLIARMLLVTESRFHEIMSLKIDAINFEKKIILFPRKKGKNSKVREILIPDILAEMLNTYLQRTKYTDRVPAIFITSNNKPVTRARINWAFSRSCSYIKGLERPITPDSLRHLYYSMVVMGYHDSVMLELKNEQRT